MSMYGMIFGENAYSRLVLAALGLTQADFGRYRDAGVADGEIWVYTRNGGGNREEYQSTIDQLAKHPCYLRDADDEFDRTYCTIYFSFPAEYADELSRMDRGEAFNPSQRWLDAFEVLKSK